MTQRFALEEALRHALREEVAQQQFTLEDKLDMLIAGKTEEEWREDKLDRAEAHALDHQIERDMFREAVRISRRNRGEDT